MYNQRTLSALSGTLMLLALEACSGSEGSDGNGAAGAPVGGATGGGAASGGSFGSASGGTSPSGGSLSSGGSVASGGAPSAGSFGSGGTSGASAGVGGAAAGGGGKSGAAGGGSGGAMIGGMGGGGSAGNSGSAGASGSGGAPPTLARFSFFLTSLEAMKRLSKSEKGFGGDLRYAEADGLSGADKICREIAEHALPGAGQKQWRAFLSVAAGTGGQAVHAIDRVGAGPWYDRLGRVVAMAKSDLINVRPRNADAVIANDLPNEYGVPNHRPDPNQPQVDNHHVLTGSNDKGQLYGATSTCSSWTSLAQSAGRPRIGFSWPASGRENWISGQDEGGCGAGVNTADTGGSDPSNPIVGSGGGYGGIYCFALTP